MWLHRLARRCPARAAAGWPPDHTALLHLPIDETHSDLRDARAVNLALARFQPEMVFPPLAQPLVRRSHREPVVTWATNVMGLVNLLEAVRRTPSVKAVVVVTSDKCWRQRRRAACVHRGRCAGRPRSASASKLCRDRRRQLPGQLLLAGRWPGPAGGLATARAAMSSAVPTGATIAWCPIWCGGLRRPPTRAARSAGGWPWQHVLDPLAGYLPGPAAWTDPPRPAGPNFGPGPADHLPVATLAERLAAHWPAIRTASDTPTGPHQAGWVALDCRKAKDELGWLPVWDIDAALQRTVLWYRQFHERQVVDSEQDLLRYVAEARQLELAWAG